MPQITLNSLLRKKKLSNWRTGEPLPRVLRFLDLVIIGVAGTIGSGIYVITGSVVQKAGPASMLSYLISGTSAVLSALCYCEFSSIYPSSGSAYSYTYYTLGELPAFVIGWSLILEYVVGASSVIRAFMVYVHSVLKPESSSERHTYPIALPFLNPILSLDLDPYSFVIGLLFTIITLYDIKKVNLVNSVSTLVCFISLLLVVIMGVPYLSLENWRNFSPSGFPGILSAASTCFYAFIGFDVVAATSEEAINPKKNIPLSIMTTIILCTLLYVSTTAIVTLMMPSSKFNEHTTFVTAFNYNGSSGAATYIITAGALFGFIGCVVTSFLPVPRILYAMAQDGLIYNKFGVISASSDGPTNAALLSGSLITFFAFALPLDDLIQMMSIGTLMAYTMVSFCTILLRYTITHPYEKEETSQQIKETLSLFPNHQELISKVRKCLTLMILAMIAVTHFLSSSTSIVATKDLRGFCLLLLIFIIIACNITLSNIPMFKSNMGTFRTPLVPWLPSASLFLNIFLIGSLSIRTWISFTIWLSLGFLVYISYGYHNSFASAEV